MSYAPTSYCTVALGKKKEKKNFFFFFFFFFPRATDQQYGIRTKKTYLKTTRSCMDTPMNMHEGAHQEINRSLLPCRHTDNDIAIHKSA